MAIRIDVLLEHIVLKNDKKTKIQNQNKKRNDIKKGKKVALHCVPWVQ